MSAISEWQPLLQGQEAHLAHRAVHGLLDVLATRPSDEASAPEEALRALLFAYCDEAFPNQGYDDHAGRFLEAAVESTNQAPLAPSLHGGLLTVGWAIDHVTGDEESNEGVDLDTALLGALSSERWTGEYDIVSGLVGIGVYAIDRLPRPSGAALLSRVLDHLEASALAMGASLSWHTAAEHLPPVQRERNPDGYFNAGLAHGVPGVAALAAMALRAGFESERASVLLRGSLAWMEELRLSDCDASYPSWVAGSSRCCDPSKATEASRTAWCYGDPGVAIAYWGAGQAAKESAWTEHAVELLRKSIRRPAASAHIRDAGLCHGTAGYAHILNRVAQASNDGELREAAKCWYGRTLRLAGADRSLEDPTFLTGIAGVALALVAASTSIAPNWDRILGIGWG